MPSPKKVAWAQLRVGIVAAASLVLLAILVFLLTGSRSFFSTDVTIYTHLSDSAALASGANVRLNGILIGRVLDVTLSGEKEPRRIVKVAMAVDEKMLSRIPADSMAGIAAENVLGSKYINIKQGAGAETVKAGGEVASMDTSEFDDVVASGYTLLNSLQGMLKRIDAIVGVIEAGEGSIGKLIHDPQLYDNLNGTVLEARKLTATLNEGKGTLGKLLYEDTIHQDVHVTIARVGEILDGIQQGQGTAGKLLKDPALYDELRQTNGEIKKLLADLNSGKGTAGKLLKSEELHNEIASTVKRLDDLLERVNTGQGTLGQLVVNPQMYENLNGMTREMQELMKDFRANPKKFLRIKLALF